MCIESFILNDSVCSIFQVMFAQMLSRFEWFVAHKHHKIIFFLIYIIYNNFKVGSIFNICWLFHLLIYFLIIYLY